MRVIMCGCGCACECVRVTCALLIMCLCLCLCVRVCARVGVDVGGWGVVKTDRAEIRSVLSKKETDCKYFGLILSPKSALISFFKTKIGLFSFAAEFLLRR